VKKTKESLTVQNFRKVKRKLLNDYAGVVHFMNEMTRERGIPSRDQMHMKREIFGTIHTLDLGWSRERFNEEIKRVDWERVFPPPEEIERMINDYLER
jgi:hypothetical protein